jgi:hypothetical protein
MKQNSFYLLLIVVFQISFLTGTHADVLDNWTTNQITTNSFGMKYVVYGNGCYVAVGEQGDGGVIYSSADGFIWTLRYSDNNGWGFTPAYSGGRFVCIGGWETAISADGTNWTVLLAEQIGYDETSEQCNMAYGSGVYVVVGADQSSGVGTINTSTDGTNWTLRTSSPAPGGYISSVTYGALKFVAVGNNDGYEYTSTLPSLGTTWTRRSIPGGSQIGYGNGLFIVPLNSNTNLVSMDGINWSMQNTGLTNQLGRVTYASGLFLACSGNYLATSSNGTNWFQYPKPLPGNLIGPFEYVTNSAKIATDGSHLVTIGEIYLYPSSYNYNGYIYTSDVLVGVRMTNNPTPKVALSGLVGRNYQIKSVDALTIGASNWRTNATLQLTNTPYVWTDSTATNSARFYRGVLLP